MSIELPSQSPNRKTLLKKDLIQIEHIVSGGSKLAITFNHYGSNDLSKSGFGESVLLIAGFDLVAIKCSENDWFQTLSIEEFRSALMHLDGSYEEIVMYGSSMGAYAALYYSAWLCCTNPMKDSPRESSVVAGWHEQTHTPRLQDQELARL